jgi:hypothetical protein
VTHLLCTHCRQRFYIKRRQPGPSPCPLCGERLEAAASGVDDDRPPLPIGLPPVARARPGSYPRRRGSYPSLTEFVRARRRRLYSRERDVGLRWRDGSALYRAAWVEETGELYVVQLGPTEEGGGHVELLAAGVSGEELERGLAGWPEALDAKRSLGWLRCRARRLAARRQLAVATA